MRPESLTVEEQADATWREEIRASNKLGEVPREEFKLFCLDYHDDDRGTRVPLAEEEHHDGDSLRDDDWGARVVGITGSLR